MKNIVIAKFLEFYLQNFSEFLVGKKSSELVPNY